MLSVLLTTAAAASSWSSPVIAPVTACQKPAVSIPRAPLVLLVDEPLLPPPPSAFLQNAAVRIACSSGASVATWALVQNKVSSVAASSVIGLAAGAVLPTPLATAAFCGTFVGMSSPLVAPGVAHAAGLGAAAAAMLATLDATNTRLLKGYGGRLGAVAALAAFGSIVATPSLMEAGLLFQPTLAAAAAAPRALATTIGATAIGATAMRLWARHLAVLLLVGGSSSPLLLTPSKRAELARRLSNPVASASVVGLLASLVVGPSRAAIAASAFAGAFVSMSAPEKLGSSRALLGAAALAGLAQVGLAAVGVGAGGKLGAAAAIGVLVLRSLRAAAAVVLLWRARARAGEVSGAYQYEAAKPLF
jgi:hypothetical protein